MLYKSDCEAHTLITLNISLYVIPLFCQSHQSIFPTLLYLKNMFRTHSPSCIFPSFSPHFFPPSLYLLVCLFLSPYIWAFSGFTSKVVPGCFAADVQFSSGGHNEKTGL